MIHFQIQPELIGNITKVILTYNGTVVQEENIEDFTKEKLLRKKEQLLTTFLSKKANEVQKGIDEHKSGNHAYAKRALSRTPIYESPLEWWNTRNELIKNLKKCLPTGGRHSARSTRKSYKQMIEIIEYYKQEILPDEVLAESGH